VDGAVDIDDDSMIVMDGSDMGVDGNAQGIVGMDAGFGYRNAVGIITLLGYVGESV